MNVPTYSDTRKLGIKKIRQYGKWSIGMVHHILTNETYAGVWRYSKLRYSENESIAVQVPAIIDRSTWNEAQKQLAHNREFSGRNNHKHKYLLGKRVYCGVCGFKMQATPNYAHNGKVYFYYACKTKRAYASGNCNNTVTYSATSLDSQVWDWIRGIITDPNLLHEAVAAYQNRAAKDNAPLRERLETVNQLLSDYRGQMTRLLDLYLSGEFAKEQLTERKARLQQSIEGLEAQREELEKTLAERTLTDERLRDLETLVGQVRKNVELYGGDFTVRQRILELLFTKATLTREKDEQGNSIKVAYVTCALGDKLLRIASNISNIPESRAVAARADRRFQSARRESVSRSRESRFEKLPSSRCFWDGANVSATGRRRGG